MESQCSMSAKSNVVLGDSPAGGRFWCWDILFFPGNPDLVILDSRNPYWDGWKPFKKPLKFSYFGEELSIHQLFWGTIWVPGFWRKSTREVHALWTRNPTLAGRQDVPGSLAFLTYLGIVGIRAIKMVMTWGWRRWRLKNWVHWVLSSITVYHCLSLQNRIGVYKIL